MPSYVSMLQFYMQELTDCAPTVWNARQIEHSVEEQLPPSFGGAVAGTVWQWCLTVDFSQVAPDTTGLGRRETAGCCISSLPAFMQGFGARARIWAAYVTFVIAQRIGQAQFQHPFQEPRPPSLQPRARESSAHADITWRMPSDSL